MKISNYKFYRLYIRGKRQPDITPAASKASAIRLFSVGFKIPERWITVKITKPYKFGNPRSFRKYFYIGIDSKSGFRVLIKTRHPVKHKLKGYGALIGPFASSKEAWRRGGYAIHNPPSKRKIKALKLAGRLAWRIYREIKDKGYAIPIPRRTPVLVRKYVKIILKANGIKWTEKNTLENPMVLNLYKCPLCGALNYGFVKKGKKLRWKKCRKCRSESPGKFWKLVKR